VLQAAELQALELQRRILSAPRRALRCRMPHLLPGFQAFSGARTFPLQLSCACSTSLNSANTSKSLGWRMPVRKEGYVVLRDNRAITRQRPYLSGLRSLCADRRDDKRMRASRMITQNFSHPTHDRDQRSPHADRDPASDGAHWLDPKRSKASATHLIAVPALGRWCLLRRGRFLWCLSLSCLGAAPSAAVCVLLAVP
jgi:hypothetical protein